MRLEAPPVPDRVTTARVVVAAVAGVAGSYALAGLTPAFVAAPVSGFMARTLPPALITFAILTLGSLGQKLNLLSAVGIVTALLGLTAIAGVWIERRTDLPLAGAAVTGGLGWLLATVLTGAPITALGAGAGAGLVMAASDLAGRAEGPKAVVDPGRRRVLGSVLSLAGVGVVGAVLERRRRVTAATREPEALAGEDGEQAVTERHTPEDHETTPAPGVSGTETATPGEEEGTVSTETARGTSVSTPVPTSTPTSTPEPEGIEGLLAEAEEKSLDVLGLEPLVSTEFYEVDINAVNPEVAAGDWGLSVTGAVENEATYGYEDLTGMAAEHRFVTLRCVGESLNGRKMDTALWTGVPVNRLLDQATPTSDCECVMLRAADGYYEEFPLEALRGGLLAYGMNGEVLPRAHGYPVRALVPGHWGEVNVKWLTEIELLEETAKGYWEKRGWHGTGPVNTVAKLHVINRLQDGRAQVAGHAYAGTRGIERVEVSVDGGEWTETTLSEPLPGEDVWRQWVHSYEPPGGSHQVVVRAVDGTGTIQTRKESNPFPSGPTGWVSRTVKF